MLETAVKVSGSGNNCSSSSNVASPGRGLKQKQTRLLPSHDHSYTCFRISVDLACLLVNINLWHFPPENENVRVTFFSFRPIITAKSRNLILILSAFYYPELGFICNLSSEQASSFLTFFLRISCRLSLSLFSLPLCDVGTRTFFYLATLLFLSFFLLSLSSLATFFPSFPLSLLPLFLLSIKSSIHNQ